MLLCMVFIFIDTVDSNYSCAKATILCTFMVLLFGGLEALLILTLRVVKRYPVILEWKVTDTSSDTL